MANDMVRPNVKIGDPRKRQNIALGQMVETDSWIATFS
jgi:hypothetical protein